MPYIRFVREDAEGAEIVDLLPAIWEICDRCRGNGSHDPDAFSNGFSMEELHEDPDFEEAYFSGRYDVPCEAGCMNGKAMVVDVNNCDKNLLEEYYNVTERRYRAQREIQMEIEAERRFGC